MITYKKNMESIFANDGAYFVCEYSKLLHWNFEFILKKALRLIRSIFGIRR